MANEAFARVKIDQLFKSADRALAGGCRLGFGHPLDGDSRADRALVHCQEPRTGAPETESMTVNLSYGRTAEILRCWSIRLCESGAGNDRAPFPLPSIDQLQNSFDAARGDYAQLKLIADELQHHTTPSSAASAN